MEFYNNLTEIVKTGVYDIQQTQKALKRTEEAIASGTYSQEYARDTLHPQAAELRKRVEIITAEVTTKSNKLIEEHAAELRAGDALDPTALTDDVRLLASGIILERRDFLAMLARNEGNATMLQAILRRAKADGIDDLGVHYIGNEEAAKQTESLAHTVGIVLRAAVEGRDLFDRLLGKGSVAHTAFCM